LKNESTGFTVVDMENTTTTKTTTDINFAKLTKPQLLDWLMSSEAGQELREIGAATKKMSKAELLELAETVSGQGAAPQPERTITATVDADLPTATMAEIKAGTAKPVMTVVINEPAELTARQRQQIVAAKLLEAAADLARAWSVEGVTAAEAAEQIAKWLSYVPQANEVWPTHTLAKPDRLTK
jgi:hypothetical protein